MNEAAADRIRPGERNELEISTTLIRRFLGIAENELVELTAFVNNKAWVGQCSTFEWHIELLRRAHDLRGFNGSYMLVNGPLCADLSARYEQNRWQPATNGRATDKDIGTRRALFIDVDPTRPKGISATNDEKLASWTVADAIRQYLTEKIGREPIGFGSSGNGYYLLIAVEPEPHPGECTERVSKLLKALGRKFGTDCVSIDATVSNPARLMSCPGTWKRKGRHTPERPHRMTSFSCALSPATGEPDRVPIGALL